MKTLVIGDIHGYKIWKNLIETENPDKIIFLGDYFDSWSISIKDQLENFSEILNFQDNFGKDKMILCLGNHDYHYLENMTQYSGYKTGLKLSAQVLLRNAVEKDKLHIIYIQDSIIFSHAGISNYWFKYVSKIERLEQINFKELNLLTLDWNSIKGNDSYGNTISNSPIWIRPDALISDCLQDYIQVVGHSSSKIIKNSDEKIYFCDTLPYEYLIIEDNKFIIKTLT